MSFQALCIISQPSVNLNLCYSPETFQSGRIWGFFAPCDLEILRMTLKNNRAPLLYTFKFYASFHSHWWVYISATVGKRSNWVKFDAYLPPVTLKFYEWPWKTIVHLFYAHSSFMDHLLAVDEFQFELTYGKDKLGFDLCDLDLWPLTLTFCMDINFVKGNNPWKFHDDMMTGTCWKRCDGQTYRQTNRQDHS